MTNEESFVNDFCHATASLVTAHPAVDLIQNEWSLEELAGRLAAWFEKNLEHVITIKHAKEIRRLLIRFSIVMASYVLTEKMRSRLHEEDAARLGNALFEYVKQFD